jgi:hypothetical protein
MSPVATSPVVDVACGGRRLWWTSPVVDAACGGRRLWLKPTGCQIQTCSNRFELEPDLSGLSLADTGFNLWRG